MERTYSFGTSCIISCIKFSKKLIRIKIMILEIVSYKVPSQHIFIIYITYMYGKKGRGETEIVTLHLMFQKVYYNMVC